MIKLPIKCRGCDFTTTNECTCQRCTAVKASGFCNTQCRNDFVQEMEYQKKRAANG